MIMPGVKSIIKSLFPNTIDTLNLERQKRTERIKIEQFHNLDETDYPETLRALYKNRTGHELDLKEPKRFTEKVQWRKLYDNDPVYSTLSDKYAVREWIEKKIGREYLIPLIGKWEHFGDIDFSQMPDRFVLKTNNASHTNIIVKDKRKFMRRKWSAGRRMEYWLKTPFSFTEGIELHYLTIKPVIIAEQFIEPEDGENALPDYKFHCFSGIPVLCQVISGRFSRETIDFYDENWEHISLARPPYPNNNSARAKPHNYELMLHLAKRLSEGFKYVRVDLYESNEKVYFGELTFTPASGMMKFNPDEWDYRLGEMWDTHSEQIDHSKVRL